MDEQKTNALEQQNTEHLHPVLMLREIWSHITIILLVTIIAMAGTYMLASNAYQPQYQTKTTFVVSSKSSGSLVYSNLRTAKGFATSFSRLLDSDIMRKQIAEKLGMQTVNATIEANAIENTNILELRVTSANPREAYLITKVLINNYNTLAGAALKGVVLDVLQYPVIPAGPSNRANIKKPVVLAFLAALLGMMALYCIITYLRDTIKSAEDAEDKLDAKLLGTIRHEEKYKTWKTRMNPKKKKTSILLTDSTTGFDFVETMKKLRTRIDYVMRKKKCKVLMVTSVLEDEGKSTVATNLALAMKRKYDKVLLIDADLKKPALHKITEHQKDEYFTIREVLKGSASLDRAYLEDEESGLWLLLGRNGMTNSTELVDSTAMKNLIKAAKKTMDVVIVDTPPMAASSDAESIAKFADASVLVVRQDKAPVKVINDMVDELNMAKAEFLGCILNDFRATEIDDTFIYGQNHYGYGKYGYGRYGYGKYGYGYGKYGYGKHGYGYGKYGYGKQGYGYGKYGYGYGKTRGEDKK